MSTWFSLPLLALLWALPSRGAELLVFAASSTTEALQDIAKEYRAKTGDTVVFSFAGSTTLARQIIAGAPADLFLSADEASMDKVDQAGLLAPGTRRTLLTNRLVVVMPRSSSEPLRTPRALMSVKRLALGDPSAVPAGVYARAWLTTEGLWDALSTRVIPTLSVRAALAAVETGAADAAVVYQSDALNAPRLRVVYKVPLEKTPPIRYPVARLVHAKGPAADGFLSFLSSERGTALFMRRGFSRVGNR